MRTLKKFGLFALLLPTAFAQSPPNVADILKKVGETYKSASQYEFMADVTTQGAASHMHFAFKAPDHYRMEGNFPGLGFGETVIVDDGFALWFYAPKTNQYGSFVASQLTADAAGDMGDLRPEALDYFMMTTFRDASKLAKDAKVLREESIIVAGVKAGCFVVAASPSSNDASSSLTLWIDKKTYRVLREDSGDTSIVFTTIKLSERLPDDLFKFVPPIGANKIETHVEPRRVPPAPPPPR